MLTFSRLSKYAWFVLAVNIAVLIQFSAGLLNVNLFAPVWMQLVHLLLVDIIWIVSILFLMNMLSDSALKPLSSKQST